MPSAIIHSPSIIKPHPALFSPTETLLAAWIAGLTGTIAAGWILSSADALRYDWAAALVIWLIVIILTLRYLISQYLSVSAFQRFSVSASQPSSFSLQFFSFKQSLLFPPFLILLAVIVATAFLYLPASHDSLSYRIPRLFLWLQEGNICYVPTSDERINYMTHNWELVSLPIFQIFGSRFLPITSVISWVLLYLLGRDWAGVAGFQNRTQNWVGLLPALSTFAMLQARSTVNDLLAATLILASAWYAFSFCRYPDQWKLTLSAFALAIACGTKPHYVTLAVPWGLWFLFARPAPWRFIPWRHVVWLLPLFLFVSPLSAFIINTLETGSYKGLSASETFIGGNPVLNMVFGSISFVWQSLQPPVNPFAGAWNEQILDSSALQLAKVAVPRFSLNAGYAQIVDGGSVGLFVILPSLVGLWLSFRMKNIAALRWIAAAGVAGFLCAVSQVVPTTIGRSFMGFFFLLLPLALCGLRALGVRALKILLVSALVGSSITLTLDAARPLFPASQLLNILKSTGMSSNSASSLLESFIGFRQRSEAGSGLVRQIPPGGRLAVISGAGDPLVTIWTEARPSSVHLAPADANLQWVNNLNPDFILVTGTGPEMHADLIRQIAKNYRFVDSEYYLVRLKSGKEKWELFAK